LLPVAVLAVLHDIRACTARAFIDNHFSDHASLYHQLALNYYQRDKAKGLESRVLLLVI
jgi:hypothetical protein